MKKLLIPVALSFTLISNQVFALSFGYFDPRSMAMGGVGVASGDASNASFYNPALLAMTHEDDDFSLVLPTIGIGAADPDDLIDALDDYDTGNYEQALDNAISGFNTSGGSIVNPTNYINTAAAVASASQNLLNGINSLSNKAVVLNANAGVLLAVPGESLGISVAATGRVVGGGVLNVTAADQALVQSYINILTCIGNIDTTLPLATIQAQFQACDTNNLIDDVTGQFTNTNTTASLTSRINARGAIITETSVSLASKFSSLGGIAIGVTPKSVEVKTFDYAVSLETADIDTDAGTRTHSDTNLDVGIAMHLTDNIKLGVVGKNIMEKEYTTVLNNIVKIEPQYRAGIAYQNSWALIGIDVDLTENEGLGFENKSQYAAIGIEFDLFDTIQARAGYRQNLSDNVNEEAGLPSVGLGFSPFGIHMDLGVAANSDELHASFQLGFKF